MADYIEDIVQRIVTKCDMTDFNTLIDATDTLAKKARKLGKAFSNAMTGEQQIALAKANEATQWNIALQRKANAEIATQNRLKAEAISKQRIETQETDKYLAQKRLQNTVANWENTNNRKAIQLSRERTAAMRAEAREANRTSRAMRGLGRLFMYYFGIQTVQNIARTGMELQLLQRSIQGLTGGTQDWDYIVQQAYKFGVGIDTVATGYRNFYSSAKMAGVGGQEIQKMYSDLLLSTRAIGANSQQTGSALLSLEQMYSKGKVSMEELRRQLGNALPGAFEIGAKAMNMTTQEFNEFVKKGQLDSAVFVPRFIAQYKKTYAGGWKDIEQTVSVARGRLTDAWQQFTLEIMHGAAGKSLAQAINQLAEVLMSPNFMKFVKILGKIVELISYLFRVLIMPLMRFCIKHVAMLSYLLGSAGLAGILLMLGGRLQVIYRILLLMTSGKVLKGLQLLTYGFWGINKQMLIVYGTVIAIIAAILVLQDVWTAWKHPDWESYTSDLIQGTKEDKAKGVTDTKRSSAQIGLNPVGRAMKIMSPYVKPMLTKNKGTATGYASNISDIMPNEVYTPPIQPQIIPDTGGYMGTLPNVGGIFNRENQNTTSVNIGDINVYSSSANPKAVAQEVQNQLISLLMSQGLAMNVEGMIT